MKKVKVFAIVFIALVATTSVKAQEFSVNADIVSSYVWRGVQYSGASIQPTLQFSTGGFSIGSWGSAGFDGFLEMDLYAKYAFDFGLTVGLTDYYYPGTDYFDNSTATGAHGYEVNLGYATGGLSIGANYILNEAGALQRQAETNILNLATHLINSAFLQAQAMAGTRPQVISTS